MSYTTPEALGISWEDAISQGVDLFKNAQSGLQTGVQVLQDPYLPEVVCEVQRLSRVNDGKAPGKRCPRTKPTSSKKGVGLKRAVAPLRAYIFHRQYPWLAPLAVASALGAIYYFGYSSGKRKK